MSDTKIKYNGTEYPVRYTIHRYLDGNKGEKVEHILYLGRKEFKGKTLDSVVDKLKMFLRKR